MLNSISNHTRSTDIQLIAICGLVEYLFHTHTHTHLYIFTFSKPINLQCATITYQCYYGR